MSKIEINEEKKNSINNEEEKDEFYNTIKKFMITNKINLNNNDHLKYMLSLTLKKDQKDIDFQYLLRYLLTYRTEENNYIFYEFFFHCCEFGKLNYISFLLNNQISVNAQNENGETPMHIAIAKRDINLIKLLIEYNPNLLISTFKDKLNCYNYADISENEEIKTLIYSKTTSSKEIKSKLEFFINNVDNKETLSSVESRTKNDILNYCGESYKNRISKIDESQLKISEDQPIKINDIINKRNNSQINQNSSNNNELISNDNEFFDKNINYKKMSNSSKGMEIANHKDLILNKREDTIMSLQLNQINNNNNHIYHKKKIGSKPENHSYKFLTEKKQKKSNKIFADFDIKRKNYSQNEYSLDLLKEDSNNNNINATEDKISNNNKVTNKESQNELELFFTEINLPKEYSEKFIDNGFDDLNLLKFQTKSVIALTNQNLIDIGITSCGERAKILIHLEEKAGIFKYFLEKEKIYITEKECKEKNINSLFEFLASINLEQYKKNFIDNGYYTAELLFTQMLTRQPLKEENLEEFKIEKRGHRMFLYNNLFKCSKDYANKLKNKGNSKMEFEGASINSCESCYIY